MLNAVARLPPGVSIDQARAQLDGVTARLAAEYPDSNKNLPATYVTPELERLLGDARYPMLILWGAVTLVLLIACANIANMLLARTADRQREFSVRVAIGGSRGRVVRQLLTENLVIALMGGTAAVGVANGSVGLLVPLIADYMPSATEVASTAGSWRSQSGWRWSTAVLVSVPPALWITQDGVRRLDARRLARKHRHTGARAGRAGRRPGRHRAGLAVRRQRAGGGLPATHASGSRLPSRKSLQLQRRASRRALLDRRAGSISWTRCSNV